MKCSQKNCNNQITGDPIVIQVGDVSKGNFWGCYCSYDCLIVEAGPALIHLREGKSLASFNTPDSMQGFVTLVNQTYGGNVIAGENAVESAVSMSATPVVQNIPVLIEDSVTAPEPMQADHNAWGDVPGFGAVLPDTTVAPTVDPIAAAIEKVGVYSKELLNQINPKLIGLTVNTTTAMKTFGDINYNVTVLNWSFPIDGYQMHVSSYPQLVGEQVKLIINVANVDAYGLKINVDEAPVNDLANACVKHFQTVAQPLKEAANANTQVAAAEDDPF